MSDSELLEEIEETLQQSVISAQSGDGKAEAAADGDPRWRVTLYASWVAQLCAMIGFAFAMPFVPFYLRDLRVPEALIPIWAGALITGSGLMMSLVAPFWGWLADRHGRKMMVQRAMFGGAVILAAMAYVHNVQQLLVLRILQGAFTGTISASVALVSSVVPAASMGFSLGLMQTAVFTGNSLGPYIGGVFAERYGYRAPFLVTGGLLLLAGLLVLFGAKERFRRPERHEVQSGGTVRELLALPGILVVLVIYTLMNLCGSFVGPIFPLFVEQVIGKPGQAASATGLLLAVTGITGAVAAVVAGRLCDRYGHKAVLVACTALTALLSFPHAAAQNLDQLLVLRAFVGLGAGGMVPAINAMVASLVPRSNLGKAYGFTATASALGWAVGPMVGGWAASKIGFRMPFVIMGGAQLVMAAVAQRWVKRD